MPPGPGALSDDATVPGPALIRRLTRVEYDNTLRDLLGVTTSFSKDFGQDSEAAGAGFVKGGAITGGDDARDFMGAAARVVEAIAPRLGTLLPCSPIPAAAADQDACATRFITQFGRRAFRRPLTEREAGLLHTLYTKQRSPEVSASFEDAMGALVGAMIQAPQFLYHWELGPNAPIKDGNLIRFGAHELASRLSYFFWASMPDEALFAAADANQLANPDQIARQAQRLLADDRARQGLTNFYLQWLEIGPLTQAAKDDTLKDFSPTVAQAMMDETRDFVGSVFTGAKGTGTLETLFTSRSTVVDASLAKIYGVTVSGTGPQPATLNPAQRAGIFTQLAFLTAKADAGDSHPVKRGDAVLRRAFCVELQAPANLMIPPVDDPVPGGATTRQRFAKHDMSPCASCHVFIDPVGFAFENYDAIGAYRTTDQGKPVDATGTVKLPSGTELKFGNAIELAAQLPRLPEVQQCVASQWMRYMLGRREVDGEAPSLKVAEDVFAKSSFSLRELLVALTRTRAFTHRTLSAGKVTP
jgi:hypothetical protein